MSCLSIRSAVALNNGLSLPIFALGTFKVRGEDVRRAVNSALDAGYTHIDTAAVYRNEEAIGDVLKEHFESGRLTRDAVFITTKLGPKDHGYNRTLEAMDASLSKLGLAYVDLYLVHWPGTQGLKHDDERNRVLRIETWRAMQDIYRAGKAKAIGVSNFTVEHLTELVSHPDTQVVPAVNQVEFHPRCQQLALWAYCDAHGIFMQAYSSLGTGELLSINVVEDIAKRRGIAPSLVLLRWGLQKGTGVIPKSGSPVHIQENARVFEFELGSDEMLRLDTLGGEERKICWDPSTIK